MNRNLYNEINELNNYKEILQQKINYLESKINNDPRINLKEVVLYFLSIILCVIVCSISSFFVFKNPVATVAVFAPLTYFASYLPKYFNSISKKYNDETKHIAYINKLSKKLINELMYNKEYIDDLIEMLYEEIENIQRNDIVSDDNVNINNKSDIKILKKIM